MKKPRSRSDMSKERFLGPPLRVLQLVLFGEKALGRDSNKYPAAKMRVAQLCRIAAFTPELYAMAQVLAYHSLDDSNFVEYGKDSPKFLDGLDQLSTYPTFSYMRYGELYRFKLKQIRKWFAESGGKEQCAKIEAALFPRAKHDSKRRKLDDDFDDGTNGNF